MLVYLFSSLLVMMSSSYVSLVVFTMTSHDATNKTDKLLEASLEVHPSS